MISPKAKPRPHQRIHAVLDQRSHYAAACKTAPRITFDRAFDLVAHTTGRWFVTGRSFSVFTCPECRSEYLTSLSLAPMTNHECPFCKLLKRYTKDPRIQASYPVRPTPRVAQMLWIRSLWFEPRGEQPNANSA